MTTKKKTAAPRLVQRIRLAMMDKKRKAGRMVDAPAYFERGGLALHPAVHQEGEADTLGPPYALSALPSGWRVARFWRLADAEAAFLRVEGMIDWRKVTRTTFLRGRGRALGKQIGAILAKLGGCN